MPHCQNWSIISLLTSQISSSNLSIINRPIWPQNAEYQVVKVSPGVSLLQRGVKGAKAGEKDEKDQTAFAPLCNPCTFSPAFTPFSPFAPYHQPSHPSHKPSHPSHPLHLPTSLCTLFTSSPRVQSLGRWCKG